MQPGDTITPGSNPQPVPVPPTLPEAAPVQSGPNNSLVSPVSPPIPDGPAISWTASEYLVHQKNGVWYVTLGISAVVVAALVYLLTRDEISTAMVVIVAVIFGAVAARKPRVIQYSLDEDGLTIAQRFYPLDDFKSFSVVEEGSLKSIHLLPLRRFMPIVTLYYPPEHEAEILETLASYMPHEERSMDPLDRLMRKVRF